MDVSASSSVYCIANIVETPCMTQSLNSFSINAKRRGSIFSKVTVLYHELLLVPAWILCKDNVTKMHWSNAEGTFKRYFEVMSQTCFDTPNAYRIKNNALF